MSHFIKHIAQLHVNRLMFKEEDIVMKNLKVRTKLNLILTLVILLVVLASAVSINNMNQVKDKALETIDASSRQSYDDSIKQHFHYHRKILLCFWCFIL